MEPPEARKREARPGIEPVQQIEAGQPGQQGGEPGLPGEAVLDALEGGVQKLLSAIKILFSCQSIKIRQQQFWNTTHKKRRALEYERALLAMTANRLCEPESKLGVWDRWLSKVYLPACEGLLLRQMYEAMDFLYAEAHAVEEAVFFHTADLLNLDVDLVFYDTTTASFSVDEEDAEGSDEPETIPLPTTLSDAARSLQRDHEIGDTLEIDPQRFRTGKAIAFAVEETTEGGNHAHHGIE
jgi:hypothetical protein